MENNESGGNGFAVEWEEEEAHVTVDSRAANGIMSRQQGYCSPSSYIPEPFRETEALQYFLRFFPYELLPDWAAEVTRRGRSKYNKPGDTFLSYDRECTPGICCGYLGASCTCCCTLDIAGSLFGESLMWKKIHWLCSFA